MIRFWNEGDHMLNESDEKFYVIEMKMITNCKKKLITSGMKKFDVLEMKMVNGCKKKLVTSGIWLWNEGDHMLNEWDEEVWDSWDEMKMVIDFNNKYEEKRIFLWNVARW